MDETALEQITRLIERRYDEGYRAGRDACRREHEQLREQLRGAFAKFDEAFPVEAKAKRQRRPETRPRIRGETDKFATPVSAAVAALVAIHPEGADPIAITRHLEAAGVAIDIRQTRLALRQLTLSGAILRIARGRYLPSPPPAPAQAAE